tara:strand:+ start:5514 stop:6395 length:882 start_codon:yes stop_codon:yes gene_type:complete
MINKVGIIGNGFVGNAMAFGFSPAVEVLIHDKDPRRSLNSFTEVVNESDIVFVSVPTPMNSDGTINLDVVYDVFSKVNEVNNRKDNVIVLKSTVLPGTTKKLAETYPKLNIVFNPEFLTERKAKFDFLNQARIVLGGKDKHVSKVASLYEKRFMHCNFVKTDYNTAEFIKYFNNVFFAVKVSFANEMKRIADKSGVDWHQALYGAVADGRLADSHLHVPGPDGKLGFGGSCFPKDINAFMSYADSLDSNVSVIKGAWTTNLEVRPEQDWKELAGRAVTVLSERAKSIDEKEER